MRMIFINLPVRDVAAATAFYQAIGFTKNAAFSNDVASAMQWSDAISVMLLDHAFYATFTDKPIADTHTTSAALFCLSFDDRAQVDAIHAAARDAGGRETRAVKDQQFMYGGAFEDRDGHTWETVFMDMAATPPADAAPEHAA
ncbi:putative lactoylglutathione lyase [Sphingomonas sp. BE138]|uniref:VOC family protein n=1 Tax=Sphingomonas sp. BE138 TaxID=2817845 RepID=UPI0028589C31|nr:VOC family protein [Sphingomonas sp. BE138]MDR6788583.1 putative lactoylglutathione lyase [Sphingomonas sp. BE138]